jgi:hypothetical protein
MRLPSFGALGCSFLFVCLCGSRVAAVFRRRSEAGPKQVRSRSEAGPKQVRSRSTGPRRRRRPPRQSHAKGTVRSTHTSPDPVQGRVVGVPRVHKSGTELAALIELLHPVFAHARHTRPALAASRAGCNGHAHGVGDMHGYTKGPLSGCPAGSLSAGGSRDHRAGVKGRGTRAHMCGSGFVSRLQCSEVRQRFCLSSAMQRGAARRTAASRSATNRRTAAHAKCFKNGA